MRVSVFVFECLCGRKDKMEDVLLVVQKRYSACGPSSQETA